MSTVGAMTLGFYLFALGMFPGPKETPFFRASSDLELTSVLLFEDMGGLVIVSGPLALLSPVRPNPGWTGRCWYPARSPNNPDWTVGLEVVLARLSGAAQELLVAEPTHQP